MHLILEQAPSREEDPDVEGEQGGSCQSLSDTAADCWHYLPVSAASPVSLARYMQKLVSYMEQNKDVSLSAICATLGNCRPQLKYRKCLAIPPHSADGISAALSTAAAQMHAASTPTPSSPSSFSSRKNHPKTVALVVAGQGIQLPRRSAHIPSEVTNALGFNPLEKYWETGGVDPVLYQLATFAVQLGVGSAVVASLGADVQVVGLGGLWPLWRVL